MIQEKDLVFGKRPGAREPGTCLEPGSRAVSLWGKVKGLADKEGKTPVVVLAEKNCPGFWMMVHSEDFSRL